MHRDCWLINYNPSARRDTETSSEDAKRQMLTRVGLRTPLSIPLMYVGSNEAFSARSSCVRFFDSRSLRILLPNRSVKTRGDFTHIQKRGMDYKSTDYESSAVHSQRSLYKGRQPQNFKGCFFLLGTGYSRRRESGAGRVDLSDLKVSRMKQDSVASCGDLRAPCQSNYWPKSPDSSSPRLCVCLPGRCSASVTVA
jgi:hypothetical protein